MGEILPFVPRWTLGPPVIDETVLTQFVVESNLIEEIGTKSVVGEGHPLYDDHLSTARLVALAAPLAVLEPEHIHRLLMRSQPAHTPGKHRQVWVGVGGRTCPDPLLVPRLMTALKAQATRLAERYRADANDRPIEEHLWDLHHELETVHPFSDGNGRTGRLWLNALRIHFGYDWLTVAYAKRDAYYASIVDYQYRANSGRR